MNASLARSQKLNLQPGQLFLTQEPWEVYTILGSCVSVTLFHPPSKLAAICHAALPFPLSPTKTEEEARQPYRYALYAIPRIIQPFLDQSIEPAEIEARLFGGSSLPVGHPRQREIFRVGKANVIEARSQVKLHGLEIMQEDVGSCQTRKIVFNTDTGEVRTIGKTPTESQPSDPSAEPAEA